jgi:hypothetical protein
LLILWNEKMGSTNGIQAMAKKRKGRKGLINNTAASRRGIVGANSFAQNASKNIAPFLFE